MGYLAISLDISKGVNAIHESGYIKEGRCSREKYSASPLLRIFENIADKMSVREAEMLIYYYQINGNNNVRSYNFNDYLDYKYLTENYEETIENELRVLISNFGKTLLKGSPNNLTKEVFSEKSLSYESYNYFSYFVKLPESEDNMVTNEVIKKSKLVEKYFLLFTNKNLDFHYDKAKNIINKILNK